MSTRAVEPELGAQLQPLLLRQVAAPEQVRNRIPLDDPEEEEVETDDEEQRDESARDLAGDEADAHVVSLPAGRGMRLELYSRSPALRRRTSRRTMPPTPATIAATMPMIAPVDRPLLVSAVPATGVNRA